MSNPEDPGFAAGFGTCMILLWFVLMTIGYNVSPSCASTVVAHHAAHYEMDPKTGNSTFHWNDESTEKASKP